MVFAFTNSSFFNWNWCVAMVWGNCYGYGMWKIILVRIRENIGNKINQENPKPLIISYSTQPITKTSKFSPPQFSQQPNKTIPKKYWRKKEQEQKYTRIITKKDSKSNNQFFYVRIQNFWKLHLVDSIFFVFLFGVEC